MNLDLKPFYETAHRIYQELLLIDTISIENVFNPRLLHENQFQNLINVLSRIGLILKKELSPGTEYSITVDGITKGKEFLNFQNWIPKDTSDLNPNRNEYYLLFLRYKKQDIRNLPFPVKLKENSNLAYYIPKILSNSEIFNFSIEINKKNGRLFEIIINGFILCYQTD